MYKSSMKYGMGVLMATIFMLSLPTSAFAVGNYWSSRDPFTAKLQIRHTDSAGKQVTVNRTIVNEYSRPIFFHGPDGEGNAMLGFGIAGISNGYFHSFWCETLGSMLTVGTKGQFTGSMDAGIESRAPVILSVDGGTYYMLATDVNATTMEAKMVVNPTTLVLGLTLKITIVGKLYTPYGAASARVIITTAIRNIPRLGPSWYSDFDRPFDWL